MAAVIILWDIRGGADGRRKRGRNVFKNGSLLAGKLKGESFTPPHFFCSFFFFGL